MSTSVKESVSVRPDLPRSEEVLGQKWDRCLADTAIKMGGGIALGINFYSLSWAVYVAGI